MSSGDLWEVKSLFSFRTFFFSTVIIPTGINLSSVSHYQNFSSKKKRDEYFEDASDLPCTFFKNQGWEGICEEMSFRSSQGGKKYGSWGK